MRTVMLRYNDIFTAVQMSDADGYDTYGHWMYDLQELARWCDGRVVIDKAEIYIELKTYGTLKRLMPGNWLVYERGRFLIKTSLEIATDYDEVLETAESGDNTTDDF